MGCVIDDEIERLVWILLFQDLQDPSSVVLVDAVKHLDGVAQTVCLDETRERRARTGHPIYRDELRRMRVLSQKRGAAAIPNSQFEDLLGSRLPDELCVTLDERSRLDDAEPVCNRSDIGRHHRDADVRGIAECKLVVARPVEQKVLSIGRHKANIACSGSFFATAGRSEFAPRLVHRT
jgi:hypothetical protein